MRWAQGIIGLLLILVGAVWILQGVGILPGSFMTGQMVWAIIGTAALLVGLRMLWGAWRQKRLMNGSGQ